MKKLPYSLKNLLAIWQQQEYESQLFTAWVKAEPRSPELTHHIQGLIPETWTKKLAIIYRLSQLLTLFFVPKPIAIITATKIFQPIEKLARWLIIWRAKRKLRQYQKNGLRVIAIAGSYGKTSLKRSLYHVLSSQFFTAMTPASYNTPLGIASSIMNQLRPDHECFLIELGEYKIGDIAELLEFTRPDVGVIAPIGFAHLERFETSANMEKAFHEMLTSPFSPNIILSDDQNRTILNEKKIVWYGKTASSALRLSQFTSKLSGSEYQISFKNVSVESVTPLLGSHQIENALPGLWLIDHWGKNWQPAGESLAYHPTTPRRLEVHHNPNKTWVVDNSYNSNPGSWKQVSQLLSELEIKNIMILTAGFVELDEATQKEAHIQLAKDLAKICTAVGIIPTRFNQDLRDALHKQKSLTVIEALTTQEILQRIPEISPRPELIWLEGGIREMYQ